LFEEFNTDRKQIFDSDISSDIYHRTEGHPFLVCFCCKVLDEKLGRAVEKVSYDHWVEYAALKLPSELSTHPTMKKLIENLRMKSSKPARRLLEHRILPSLRPVTLSHPSEARVARFLTSSGAAECTDGAEKFKIPSPLFRTVLATRVPLFHYLLNISLLTIASHN
jgi:hypothetical protein